MATERTDADSLGADEIAQTREYAAALVADRPGAGRKYPIGAEVLDGRIDFRLWAPGKERAELVIEAPETQVVSMVPQEDYFSTVVADPGSPVLYRFRLDGRDQLLPDLASRFQPQGPHGPSEVVDAARFTWTDRHWQGPTLKGQVIYEMHVGTFTPEGTWTSATRQLIDLADAGITLIEMMPIADFAGRFGWGYDGVNLFAPTRLYGRPDDLRGFINTAHELGIGIILDVVYNHVGSEGDHFRSFSQDYFTDRYTCEWGDAINFDGPNSQPVREFFIANARYWIEEFHFDGFRIDATQQIFDASKPGIIAEIVCNARQAAGRRSLVILAENEPQRTQLLRGIDEGGSDLDALCNDDFQHSMRIALTGRSEAYYSDFRGLAQELVSVAKHGFLYQGQRSRWQNQPRGTPARGIDHARFVCYLENHDQVANSARGYRLGQLTSPGRHRAATALLLLGPWTPLIFQGQEFAATTPFVFFADHDPAAAATVAEGRKKFLSQFPSLAIPVVQEVFAEPSRVETFLRSKLDLRQRIENAAFYRMFRSLTRLRTTDEVFSLQDADGIDGAVLSDRAFVLRFFGPASDRLVIVNFGADLLFAPCPEPLLAPLPGCNWRALFSSEDPRYGGSGTPALELDQGWRIPAESAIALACEPSETSPTAPASHAESVQAK